MPPYGKSQYNPSPNDKGRTGIRRSGKSNLRYHPIFYRKSWGTSPELNSICTPWLCQNLYLAPTLPSRLLAKLARLT